ncbi:MAG: glycosyltransferase family 4 protein [Caldiserica bacterium]|nr:glycosyltransferase family 4 protein [Caldisericota bacterium]
MKKIKVAHIITRMVKGGAQENTLYTVKHLAPQKYDTYLISGPPLGGEGSIEDRIPPHVKFVKINELIRPIHPYKDIIAFVKIFLLCLRENFDIVHTHTSKAGILGRWAAKLSGTRIIVHTPHGHIFYGYERELSAAFYAWVERITAWITDTLITLTERGKIEHLERGISSAERIKVIYSGVEIEKFSLPRDKISQRRALGLPEGAKIVGCVGRMVPVKGHIHFLEAACMVKEKYPEAYFVLQGEGPLKKELMEKAKSLSLSSCCMFLSSATPVQKVFSSLDVFVLPSLNEGMGRVLVEAMATGLPIVASRVGGVPELVRNGINGYLVPPGDEDALAASITSLLKEPALASRMGEKGKEMSKKFSAQRMLAQIESLYKELWEVKVNGRISC